MLKSIQLKIGSAREYGGDDENRLHKMDEEDDYLDNDDEELAGKEL